MSQVHSKKSKIKKLEESSSGHSDYHDDTELQTPQIPNPQRALKNPTKVSAKEVKVSKKEQDKTKVSKNQPVKKHQHKTFEDDQKLQRTCSKKYEGVKSVKDFAQDDIEEKHIEPAKNSKKNRKKKVQDHEKMEENQKRAHQIIEKLDKVYDEDVELYKQGKPADKKLKYILEIEKTLKEVELAKNFLDMDGHLVFIDWLLPNPETRQETSLTVKIHVFNMLADMRLTKENIEAGAELEKVLKKYRKSRYEILRNLSASIVQKCKILKALPNA